MTEVLSTSLFTYDSRRRAFTTEASDLKLKLKQSFPTHITLRSARTERDLTFTRNHELIDSRENELLAVVYGVEKWGNSAAAVSRYGDLQVVIYND